jgi:23S rRNA maturation mini-RNase III
MMGGEAVWDIYVFRHLLEWYRTIEVLVAKQWMMVEAASTLSMLTRVETNDL